MNHFVRLAASAILLICTCILTSGCAMLQPAPEKSAPSTVSEWMSQDRVEP